MKRILVAYTTFSGSTAEVAGAIGEELGKCGLQADVAPAGEVKTLDGYDGVVLGGPMIMGWHRPAQAFLRRHRAALQGVPLAVFATAMSLTETGDASRFGVPVFVDEKLPKPPATAGRLTLRERWATLSNYLRPIVGAARPAKPVSIGVFGGRLEYGRLKPWAVLFVMVIVQAPAGDRRNWESIRSWAAGLPAAFGAESIPMQASTERR